MPNILFIISTSTFAGGRPLADAEACNARSGLLLRSAGASLSPS
jgi:hypothetical protein